jgi:hypothetical protein
MQITLQNGQILYFRPTDVEESFFELPNGRMERAGQGTIYGNMPDGTQVRLQTESTTHDDTVFERLSGTNVWTDMTYAVYDNQLPYLKVRDSFGLSTTGVMIFILVVFVIISSFRRA